MFNFLQVASLLRIY